MGRKTFLKKERLKKEKLIQELFEKGSSFNFYPIRVLHLPLEHADLHQALFSVSSRSFKLAVVRNKIKRRMRESYRLNKEILPQTQKLALGFLYTGKNELKYGDIDSAMTKSIEKLVKIYHN